jgi:spore coat polysaccharide biosynthesis protein SpsF
MIVASIQARLGSTRLPGKMLKKIHGKTLLKHVYDRLSSCKEIDKIIIATTTNLKDNLLEEYCKKNNLLVYRGDEEDIAKRHLDAAKSINATAIIRICGDCPLIDPKVIDQGILLFKQNNADFVSNRFPKTYPQGLNFEIYKISILQEIMDTQKGFNRRYPFEHIYSNQNKYKLFNLDQKENLSHIHLTVDYQQDLELIGNIISKSDQNYDFSLMQTMKIINQNPSFLELTQKLTRSKEYKSAKESFNQK